MSWIKTTKDLKKTFKPKKVKPFVRVEPCAAKGCRRIDTTKMEFNVQGEIKLVPLCPDHI